MGDGIVTIAIPIAIVVLNSLDPETPLWWFEDIPFLWIFVAIYGLVMATLNP